MEEKEIEEIRRSAMSLFAPQGNNESLADRLRREVLPNIANGGTVNKTIEHIINKDSSQILDLGSGAARIQRGKIKHFSLIMSQPAILADYNPFTIRCSLCHKVVSYPAWYYVVKYDVNHFHYFVCFDSRSPNKPSTKCYRRK